MTCCIVDYAFRVYHREKIKEGKIRDNKLNPKRQLTDKIKRRFFQAAVVPILQHGRSLNVWRKSMTATTKECCQQYWTSPWDSTPQSSSCTATNHLSRKLSKLNEPDMRNTAGEVGMYSCGPLHMEEQRQDDQFEPTYSCIEPIRHVALKTCRKQWTIRRGGERGSGISVLMA